MAKSAAQPDTAQSFETALSRLEAIVERMDSDTVPLEQLIADYEEGVKLVRVCQDKLKDAEQKIEIITRSAQGDAGLAAFDPAEKPSDEPPPSTRKSARLF